MSNNILFLENDPEFIKTRTIFLEKAGYNVYKALTIEEAEVILEKHWIELILIDVRLVDNNDTKDRSGLEFAVRPTIRAIPKIIMTAYPNFEDMRAAISSLKGEPDALDYIDKARPTKEMVSVVDQVFARQEEIVGTTTITWDRLSPLQLINFLIDDVRNVSLTERVNELERVFLAAFPRQYTQLIISPLSVTQGDTVHTLIIRAISEHAHPDTFVAYCATTHNGEIIEQARENFNHIFPGETAVYQSATMRFALFTHRLERFGRNLTTSTFKDLFNLYDVDYLSQLLRRVQFKQLNRLHGPTTELICDLSNYFKVDIWADMQEQLSKLNNAAQKAELGEWLAPELTISKTVWDQLLNIEPQPLKHGVVHGNLENQTIIFNEVHKVWVVDFTAALLNAPLLLDYIRWETNLRAEWCVHLRYEEWFDFEQALISCENLDTLPGRWQKQIAVLQTIRQIAQKEAGCDEKTYIYGLMLNLAEQIKNFDPSKIYLPRYIKWFLAAAVTLDLLLETTIKTTPVAAELTLRFNESQNQLVVNGEKIELTPGECELFAYLFKRRNEVVSRLEIAHDVDGVQLDDLHEDDAKIIEYQRITTMINRIRRRLSENPLVPDDLIKTIRGKGYMLNWPNND